MSPALAALKAQAEAHAARLAPGACAAATSTAVPSGGMERIRRIVVDELSALSGVPVEHIRGPHRLRADLGLDGLALVSLALALETRLAVSDRTIVDQATWITAVDVLRACVRFMDAVTRDARPSPE